MHDSWNLQQLMLLWHSLVMNPCCSGVVLLPDKHTCIVIATAACIQYFLLTVHRQEPTTAPAPYKLRQSHDAPCFWVNIYVIEARPCWQAWHRHHVAY